MGGVVDQVFDALFPRFCLSCKEEGGVLCEGCTSDFCDLLKYEGGEHIASFAYGNPVIRDLIKTWKYHFDQSAWRELRKLATPTLEGLRNLIKEEGIGAVTFVPLSRRRLCERGFNQAELIARWLSKECHVPVVALLDRRESVGHQAEKTDEERAEAMKESPFILKYFSNTPIYGGKGGIGNVLIVDDVWTTGSTLKAAEKTLLGGDVDRVFFYTLAKGR